MGSDKPRFLSRKRLDTRLTLRSLSRDTRIRPISSVGIKITLTLNYRINYTALTNLATVIIWRGSIARPRLDRYSLEETIAVDRDVGRIRLLAHDLITMQLPWTRRTREIGKAKQEAKSSVKTLSWRALVWREPKIHPASKLLDSPSYWFHANLRFSKRSNDPRCNVTKLNSCVKMIVSRL